VEVVEDRLVPGESLEAHDLLGEERAVLPELDVTLAGHAAEALIGRHGDRISAALKPPMGPPRASTRFRA
jgi:hypothetical protein